MDFLCYHPPMSLMPGDQFCYLTILHPGLPDPKNKYWVCRCRCGAIRTVAQARLSENAREPTRSCGCWTRDRLRKHGEGGTNDGQLPRSPEYRAWKNMKNRCLNPNAEMRQYYSEQGVTIHPAWQTSFSAFLADVGRRPSAKHSLDRYPDPYGNYAPGNVRWATSKEQRMNQRARS